jgi:hypothetical protein
MTAARSFEADFWPVELDRYDFPFASGQRRFNKPDGGFS